MALRDPSLDALIAAIPPPSQPLRGAMRVIDRPMPTDFIQMVQSYGSGAFEDDNYGYLIWLVNPFEFGADKKDRQLLERVRGMLVGEEEGERPYGVFPESPGLIPWASGEQRMEFFWHSVSDNPAEWTIVSLYDGAVFSEFRLSTTEFVKKLLLGEIDSLFLGIAHGELSCQSVRFDPRLLPLSVVR